MKNLASIFSSIDEVTAIVNQSLGVAQSVVTNPTPAGVASVATTLISEVAGAKGVTIDPTGLAGEVTGLFGLGQAIAGLFKKKAPAATPGPSTPVQTPAS